MSQEIAQPFQLTPSGGVAVTTVPSQQVQQHLQSLVSTNPGERVMQPTYGVALANYVFSMDTGATAVMVSNDVSAAVAKWEPAVNIQDVRTLISDTSLGLLSIDVDYSPGSPSVSASPSVVQTAVLLVGGDVVSA